MDNFDSKGVLQAHLDMTIIIKNSCRLKDSLFTLMQVAKYVFWRDVNKTSANKYYLFIIIMNDKFPPSKQVIFPQTLWCCQAIKWQ